tara:strand:- start:2 stop:181 length:180 start_codon:yes stop_codon:yes gene_type:complete
MWFASLGADPALRAALIGGGELTREQCLELFMRTLGEAASLAAQDAKAGRKNELVDEHD